MEQVNLAVYVVVIVVSIWVARDYGSHLWTLFRTGAYTESFKLRAGIAGGWAVTGFHAAVWGIQRHAEFLGMPDIADGLYEFGTLISFLPRLSLVIFGLMHLDAIWQMRGHSGRWKRESLKLAILYAGWLVLLDVLEPAGV